MSNLLSQPPAELICPDFRIYGYTEQIYKIVRFKSTAPRLGPVIDKQKERGTSKLDSAVSRARRVVLELALCNDWKYFCTFTIAEKNCDRKDLAAWHKKFSQWLRDQRKKYLSLGYDFDISYVLVPEQHQDGSWHMHGLFSDITPVLISFKELWDRGENVPYKLVKNGYLNWLDYQNKFGFCSFGAIRNKVAAGFYVTKYINKTLQDTCVDVGLHLYYPSRGLNRSHLHGEIYGQCAPLEKFLTNHYDFCDTGFTAVKDGCDWTFALEYMDAEMLEAFQTEGLSDSSDIDCYFECVQEVLDGF